MALGKQIRRYREQMEWTLETLSEKSGVDVGTISAIENRDSQRSKYANALAKALGLTLDQLLDESNTYTPCFTKNEVGPTAKPSDREMLTPDMVLELVRNALLGKPSVDAMLHHIDHAWPFKNITRDQWLDLTEEQRAAIEAVAASMMSTHHSAGSGGQHEKRQAA